MVSSPCAIRAATVASAVVVTAQAASGDGEGEGIGGLLAHVPEKWAPVFRPGHAPTQKRSGAYPTGYAPSACPAKVGTGFPTRTCANSKRSGAYPTGYAPSACPGKVGTGFPTRTCANAKKKRSVSNGIRS